MSTRITLGPIRHAGTFAGQKAYQVDVTYTHDDGAVETVRVSFAGPTSGDAPVSVVTVGFPGGIWVREPGRFGESFGPEWIRNYYADRP